MMPTTRPFLLLLLLLLTAPVTLAQQPSSNNGNDSGFYGQTTFNPTVAVLIVVLVSAFFFLGFFSIFLRQCQGDGGSGAARSLRGGIAGVMGRSRRQRGLDRAVLDTFPTLVYSEVKEHKIGKGVLECAVCLSEFEDEETLRLLPKCSHVFHPDCIDAWLESHVTCPVCRSNLVPDPDAPSPPAADLGTAAAAGNRGGEAVAIDVDSNERGEEGGREIRSREEAVELDRIGSQRRATRTSRFPRSHSTGHSLAVQREEGLDRFTLRLPDHIRKEIIAAGKLKRSRSLLVFPTGGEGSSRRGYRGGGGGGGGEGSSRGGRSIRLGRTERWNSFLARTFSARFPPWATGRRGEGGDGSVKKGDGEGSSKGKLGSVKGSFDCLGGGGGAVDDESPAERV